MSTISVDDLPRTLAQREADELSELQHQIRLVTWADEMASSGLRPELAMLFAIPNGMWTTPAQAGKAKASGLRSGVPDLCLPIPRGGFVALWIEMKSARGRESEEQKQWHKRLVAHGSLVVICFSHQQAAQTLTEYLDSKFVRPTPALTGDVLIFDEASAIAMRGPFALMDVTVQPSPPHIDVVELAMKRLRRLDKDGRDVTEEFGLWDESDRWQLVTP